MNANALLALAKHCLHLCSSQNFEETLVVHLLQNGTKANMFITNNPAQWAKVFAEKGLSVEVKTPEELNKGEGKGKKIVVDSSSLGGDFASWEQKWEKLSQVVCIYNLDKIDAAALEKLVAIHDKMVLSVNNVRMFSGKKIQSELESISPELVESVVKKELHNIVLALLMMNPMCGSDLIKALYSKFKVFVSPGTLYPTLHELEKSGLLTCEYKLKNKIYSVSGKERAQAVLKSQAEANLFVTQLLEGD